MADLALWFMDKSELVIYVRNCDQHYDTLVFAGWNNFLIDHFAGTDLCQTKNRTINVWDTLSSPGNWCINKDYKFSIISLYPLPIGIDTPFSSTASAVYDSILLTETINDRWIRLKRFDGKRDSISCVLILDMYSRFVVMIFMYSR